MYFTISPQHYELKTWCREVYAIEGTGKHNKVPSQAYQQHCYRPPGQLSTISMIRHNFIHPYDISYFNIRK